MAQQHRVPLNEYLYTRANTGVTESGLSPLIDAYMLKHPEYRPSTPLSPSVFYPELRDNFFKNTLPSIQGNADSVYQYDPTTDEILFKSHDDEFDWGNIVQGLLAAGVGGLAMTGAGVGAGAASGFGNPEMFNLIPQTGANLTGGLGANGGGMWDWLDEIGSNFGNPEADNLIGQDLSGGSNFGNPEIDNLIEQTGSNLTGGSSGLKLSDAVKLSQLLGGGANSLGGLLTGGAGGNGGGLGGGLLGSAFNATPFLLALAQANKQGGDLDEVIRKINGEGYTNSVLNPYDLQTGLQRTALTESLGNRGVLGSSFGQNDINNFNYMRDLGRGDLASKASLASAGLEGSLINQRNTNTNMLLGAGLNASGRLFSPQKDPFNLAALLGG